MLNESSKVKQHAVDNIEQRPTQHRMCKCPNLNKVSKVISILRGGVS